jgi:hypothetical protein
MNMIIGKTRTNQPVEGYLDAPVFDATIELKDGKEVLVMEQKDKDYIFENQPMVFGVRLPDEDDPSKHQVVYFQQLIGMKETADAIVYQVIIPDEDAGTIEQKTISVMNDSDTIKVSLDSVTFTIQPQLYYHEMEDENGDILLTFISPSPLDKTTLTLEEQEELFNNAIILRYEDAMNASGSPNALLNPYIQVTPTEVDIVTADGDDAFNVVSVNLGSVVWDTHNVEPYKLGD